MQLIPLTYICLLLTLYSIKKKDRSNLLLTSLSSMIGSSVAGEILFTVHYINIAKFLCVSPTLLRLNSFIIHGPVPFAILYYLRMKQVLPLRLRKESVLLSSFQIFSLALSYWILANFGFVFTYGLSMSELFKFGILWLIFSLSGLQFLS